MRISRTLGVEHGTVRQYAAAAEFPERAPHRRQRSILDPYLAHLTRRHADGCESAMQLWREVRALGYQGTAKQVRRWLQGRRQRPALTAPWQCRQDATAGGARDGAHDAAAHRATSQSAASQASTAVPLPSPTQLAWLLDSLPESDA